MSSGEVSLKVAQGVPVLEAAGEFDVANVDLLRDALLLLDAQGGTGVVDFTDVTFADSTVIGVIVGAHKRCAAREGELRLVVAPASSVAKVIDITGVDKVVATFESLGDATADLRVTE